jgi:hypothetical protein
MQELRPRSFFFGNICIKFSVYCLCSVLYKAMFASLYQWVLFLVDGLAVAHYRWLLLVTVGCYILPLAVTLYSWLLLVTVGCCSLPLAVTLHRWLLHFTIGYCTLPLAVHLFSCSRIGRPMAYINRSQKHECRN